MKLSEAHKHIIQQLASLYDKDQAITIAWWLLEALTGNTRAMLMSVCNQDLSDEQQSLLGVWLTHHIEQHKPLAYIIGSVPFCDLTISVVPPVLIPRPETEEWVMRFIDQLHAAEIRQFSLLDVCTGSGCIALAIAHAFPQAHVYASDINPHALACARENAKTNAIANVTFVESDVFAAFQHKQFDFIVSNPPYIAHHEESLLAPSVRMWESPQALYADDDGHALIKRIIDQAPLYLTSSPNMLESTVPRLCIEIGYRQGAFVSAYMKERGYTNVHVHKDYADHDRVVCGRYSYEGISTNNE